MISESGKPPSPLRLAALCVEGFFGLLFQGLYPTLQTSSEDIPLAAFADAYLGIMGQTNSLLLGEAFWDDEAHQSIRNRLRAIFPKTSDPRSAEKRALLHLDLRDCAKVYGDLLIADEAVGTNTHQRLNRLFARYREDVECGKPTAVAPFQLRECVLAGSRVAEYAFYGFYTPPVSAKSDLAPGSVPSSILRSSSNSSDGLGVKLLPWDVLLWLPQYYSDFLNSFSFRGEDAQKACTLPTSEAQKGILHPGNVWSNWIT